jgi:NADPH:quinone reductase-like Zn-dependent oxidoreductase
MRALVITKRGGPDVLAVEERPDPEPGPGEVRVAVRAAGINFADLMARVGLYPDAPDLPTVVGYEVAGEVDALGDGVDDLSEGDRVIAGTRFGGQAELVVAESGNVVPLPGTWSFEEGAAMPVNYMTAYAALVRYGSLREGERVLIHAAAGGVGIAATQIARILGAEIYGTASEPKHGATAEQGVDHPIDYRKKDFAEEVRRIAGEKRPLDVVLDAVGGKSFEKSYALLRAGGRLVCFGASSAMKGDRRSLLRAARMYVQTPRFHPVRELMPTSRAVIGLNLLTLWDERGTLDDIMEPLAKWAEEGRIRPVVDEAFPLERGADAHRHMAGGANVGKIVLTT